MKKLISMLAVFAMAGLVVLNSCKDDEDPTPLTVATLTANDTDLNGATSATGVATNAVITSEFSTDIDATTANDNTIVLTRTFDNSTVAKAIVVSGNKITITPSASFFEGDQYKIAFTSDLKSTQGMAVTAFDRTFGTKGIGLGTAPQSAKQIMYLQFTGDVVDVTGKATKSFSQVAFQNDRFGNANAAANFRGNTAPGNGDIVELSGSSLIAPSMTISLWILVNQTDFVAPGNRPLLGLGGNNGYFVEFGDGPTTVNWVKMATNHKVDPDPKDRKFATQWGEFNKTDGNLDVNTLFTTGWHHLVITFDAASYTKSHYWDGVKIKSYNTLDSSDEGWNLKDMMLNAGAGIDPKLALGFFASRANTNPDWAQYPTAPRTFKGGMDDLRLFNAALTASEVTTLYNAEKPQ